MTIISAVRTAAGVFMGADNHASDGDRFMPRLCPKLWAVSPHISVGTSGLARLTDVLRAATWPQVMGLSAVEIVNELSRHFSPLLRSEFDGDGGRKIWALIAIEDKLFQLSADLSIVALDVDYWSIGSAELVAMGALAATRRWCAHASPREQLVTALDACAMHLHNIKPPWVFVETTKAA